MSAAMLARQAASQPSYQTEHFHFFWSTDATHGIKGAGASVAAGDEIPRLIREASIAMEKAWRLYVDTLGYLPPKPLSTSYGWGLPVAAGKLPVEFGHVAKLANYGDPDHMVYGISGLETGGATGIVLAANLAEFVNWSYYRDIDGKLVGSDYKNDWVLAIQATASHEFFHSIQYRYDTRLEESTLFEASAVAMERKVYPEETDYLSFLGNPDVRPSSGLAKFETHGSLFGAGGSYEHAWFVTQLMQDRGDDILKRLWEFNKENKTSYRKALRNVLRNDGWSLDSTLLRYAVRVGRTGRRSTWNVPSLAGFTDAAMFPRLSGTLQVSADTKFDLEVGRIQEWIDTASPNAERLVVWIPEPGVSMARTFVSPSGTGWEVCKGSVRLHGRDRARNVWSIANAGPPELLPGATANAAKIRLFVTNPPDSIVSVAGDPFSWRSSSGIQLAGTAKSTASSTPLAHLDEWRPDPAIEDWAARTVSNGGHALVLEDADRRLALTNATVKLPFAPERVYVGNGDGKWFPATFRSTTGGVEVSFGELDLSTPIRILTSNGGVLKPKAMDAQGNPSTGGKPIRFPLDGATDGAVLQILAQDGSCVRRLRSQWGRSEVVWDLKNEGGQKVRPGVYWYVWENVVGARRGTLLVGE